MDLRALRKWASFSPAAIQNGSQLRSFQHINLRELGPKRQPNQEIALADEVK